CPPISQEQRQEMRSRLSQPRVHETASKSDGQVHFLPTSPTLPLVGGQESGNLALESSTIIQFPSSRFYLCPECDILLIDELETLYEWDGVFAHYIHATGWKDFCDLLTVMAFDPFYDPFGNSSPPPKELRCIETFAAYVADEIKRLPQLEEVILLLANENSTSLEDVEKYMKILAFRKWIGSTGNEMAKEKSINNDNEEDEKMKMEKALSDGWEHHVPKITILE
ncbi:hypothetical protein N431DRAFT_344165, partial [Stipitochalara longipes BDJ]